MSTFPVSLQCFPSRCSVYLRITMGEAVIKRIAVLCLEWFSLLDLCRIEELFSLSIKRLETPSFGHAHFTRSKAKLKSTIFQCGSARESNISSEHSTSGLPCHLGPPQGCLAPAVLFCVTFRVPGPAKKLHTVIKWLLSTVCAQLAHVCKQARLHATSG